MARAAASAAAAEDGAETRRVLAANSKTTGLKLAKMAKLQTAMMTRAMKQARTPVTLPWLAMTALKLETVTVTAMKMRPKPATPNRVIQTTSPAAAAAEDAVADAVAGLSVEIAITPIRTRKDLELILQLSRARSQCTPHLVLSRSPILHP